MPVFFNCQTDEFLKLAESSRLVCFGVSKHTDTFCRQYGSAWMKNVACFVDNDKNLWGTEQICAGAPRNVFSPDKLRELHDAVIVITVADRKAVLDIVRQIKSMEIGDSVRCCSLLRIEEQKVVYDNSVLDGLEGSGRAAIEKKIHCCWFSGDIKPMMYQECIDSWKRHCPEYEIIEWNAKNYDVSKNRYMLQAYEKRQWAFVSDYARLDLVYQHGGLYFDMDVEFLRSINDLLKFDAFFCFDNYKYIDLGSGFGAKKGFHLLKKLLDNYDSVDFIGDFGKADWRKTIPQPQRLLHTFREFGFVVSDKSQIINNTCFFSPDYIRCISDSKNCHAYLTGTEYAIHHHNAGWVRQELLDERNAFNQSTFEWFSAFR